MNVTAAFLLCTALVILGDPANAQWTKITGLFDNGLHGAPVRALAISGTSLFAGTERGSGVVLSTDSGTTWAAANTGLSYDYGIPNVYALAVSGTNLFAGTSNGVYLSTNNGGSWAAVNAGLSNQYGYGLTVLSLAVIGTNLFAGTMDGGVYRSSNSGTGWIAVNTGLTNASVYTFAISPASGGAGGMNLFAGTFGGVFRSSDNGGTWTGVNDGLPPNQYGHLPWVNGLALSPASDGSGGSNLFAGTDRGVFLSTDNGTSWSGVNTGLTNTWVYSIAVTPAVGRSGTNLLTGTSGDVYLSTDNGASWTPTSLTNSDIRAIGPSGTNLFAGSNNGGIFRSTDGGATWTGGGPSSTQITSLAASASSGQAEATNLFAGTYGDGVYLSSDNGTNWTQTGLTNTRISALAVRGTNVFANGSFLSTNNGATWTQFQHPGSGITAVAFSPNSGGAGAGNLFVAEYYYNTNGRGGNSIDISTDNGASWRGLWNWNGLHVSGRYIFVYGGGSTLAVGGVRFSSDNGTTWSVYHDVGMPNVPLTGRIQSIAVLPSSGGQGGTDIFAATLGGVLRSSDNGTSWTRAGLTDIATYAIEASGTNLFAGTGGYGAYCSTDGGTSWTQVNDGLPNGYVFSLVVSGTHLYAAPRDVGWWRRPLSEMVTSAASELPHEFQLLQNYPNPFNPSTTIRYGLPQKSQVSLTVYNTLGQLVSELVSGEQEAGYHDVIFSASGGDGAGLASGMYFYRLYSGDVVQVKKMVLVK